MHGSREVKQSTQFKPQTIHLSDRGAEAPIKRGTKQACPRLELFNKETVKNNRAAPLAPAKGFQELHLAEENGSDTVVSPRSQRCEERKVSFLYTPYASM